MSQSKKINDTKMMIKLADMCVFLKPWRSPENGFDNSAELGPLSRNGAELWRMGPYGPIRHKAAI
jgi:hypothetical protein